MLSSEQKGYKPMIKGQVSMAKMKARKPLMAVAGEHVPNIYTYADSIKSALEKGRLVQNKPLFNGLTTMKNTTGRDNKMYYVSDGFNLNTSNENEFTSLMTLNNVASSKTSLSTLQVTPRIPNIRSMVIPNSSLMIASPVMLQNSELKLQQNQ